VRCQDQETLGEMPREGTFGEMPRLRQTAASTEVEEFSTKFDKEFSLIACLSSRTTTLDTWYIDSGASRHMTSVREHLTDLTQCGDVEVVFGDDWEVKVAGCGIVSFRRESLPPMTLTEVLYVSGLKKNLVSVSSMRYCSVMGKCFFSPEGLASLRPK
jgi:hypothetical protein